MGGIVSLRPLISLTSSASCASTGMGAGAASATGTAGGIVATVSFALLDLDSGTPLVGASGAISGVLGLYFLLFAHNRVRVFVWLWIFIRVVMLPARWVLGVYVVIDNLFPILFAGSSNVAYGAHLGGFLAGLAIAFIGERMEWMAPGSEQRERSRRGPQILDFKTGRAVLSGAGPDRAPEPDLVRSIEAAVEAGEADRAVFHYVNARPQDHELLSTESIAKLSEWLAIRQLGSSASKLLRRRIHRVRGRARSRLLLSLARVRALQGQKTSAYQSLLDALQHEPDYRLEVEIRAELEQLSRG